MEARVRESTGTGSSASVRTVCGVFDVELRDGSFHCSCGMAPDCVHCDALSGLIADRLAAERR